MMRHLLYLILTLVLLTGCSRFQRVMKKGDWKEKYDAGMAYYKKGDYYRASALFEDLLPNIIGKAEAEETQFFYAYCQYHLGNFQSASHYFKAFYDTYKRSRHSQEAYYMHAYALYMSTPEYNLDQSNTNTAINEMQEFLNRYPTSDYSQRANDIILRLRQRLEIKAFSIAKQYHRLRRFQAAVIAAENFRKDFPDSDLKEEMSWLQLDAQYEYARNSIYTVQEPRYQEAVNLYYQFVERYPQSEFKKDADKVFTDCQRDLAVLRKRLASASVN